MNSQIEAIFIGASAGGVTAIQRLLGALDNARHVPIIIVQHLPQAANLNPDLIFGHVVKNVVLLEANDKMKIEKGHIYFAPPGYHLLIEKDRSFSLSRDELVNMARPSIDVVFETAAIVYGHSACGILMTGTNSDGALGLKTIHDEKGLTFVQDPDDAEFDMMPKSAIDLFKPNYINSINVIAKILSELLRGETP